MARTIGRSGFHDRHPDAQAAEMEMRSPLLQGLGARLGDSRLTQIEVA